MTPTGADDPDPQPSTIVVRRAEPDDAAALRDIMAQPDAQRGTLQTPFPSVAQWRASLEDQPDDAYRLVACLGGASARPVGHLGVRVEPHPRRRHVASLGMAVHDDFARLGVGTALMRAGLELCDDWLQVTRVELMVSVDNEAALALYRKFGFVIEGTQRDAVFWRGEFVDLHVMARRRPVVVPHG